MTERTWRCTECRHFVFPNYCIAKKINVDRNYDDYCDLAEEIEELKAPDECAGCYREKTCELWRNELIRDEIIENGCDLYDQNRPTNFDRITAYPRILAENLVYHRYDEFNDDEWFGVTGDGIRESFKTREKAVIATLEWLGKEVEK